MHRRNYFQLQRVYLQNSVLPSRKVFFFFSTVYSTSEVRFYLKRDFLLSKECVYRQTKNFTPSTYSLAYFPTNRTVAGTVVSWAVFLGTHYNFKILKIFFELSVCDYKSHGDSRFTVAYRGGFGVFNPPPEILKALQNRAKLNPIVKILKNCWI